MQSRGFERTDEQLHFRGTHVSETYGSQISVFISVPRGRAFLNIYIDINPLTDLHRRRDDYGTEEALDGRENWLHPDDVGEDNRSQWDVAHDLIWENEAYACDLAEGIARDLGHSTFGSFLGATVDRMELTCDFGENNPLAAVTRIRPAFQSAFSDVRANDLPDAFSFSERLEGDVQILHGNWRAGTCFRLYAKTNQRIRLECEVRKNGFRSLGIARSLDRHESEYSVLFQAVADEVIEPFNAIIEADVSSSRPSGRGMDFVLGVSSTVRDPGFARRIIESLITNDRVTSRMDGARIRRLAQRGYLEQVRRGLYRIAPCWRTGLTEVAQILSGPSANFLWGPEV